MSTTKTEAFLQRLMDSDLGRRIMAEAESEAAGQEARQAKAATLAALREGRTAFMASVQAEIAEAEGRLKAARQELREATANYNTVLSTTYGKQWAYDEDIRQAEAFLSASAPGPLKRALEAAEAKLERLRLARVERVIFPDLPEAVGWKPDARPKRDAMAERTEALAELQGEIDGIREQILRGE